MVWRPSRHPAQVSTVRTYTTAHSPPLSDSVVAGLGTIEELGEVAVVAGTTYKITVKYTNVPAPISSDEVGATKQPPLMMAALRVGGAMKLDDDQAIEDAVRLAEESDTVVLVIGLNMDWEAEASDRADLGDRKSVV